MKRRKMTLAALFAALTAALCTVPAFADLIIPGQPTGPRHTPPAPVPTPTPDPTPVPTPPQPDTTLLTALIVAVAVIAAAVIAWVIVRRRRANARPD